MNLSPHFPFFRNISEPWIGGGQIWWFLVVVVWDDCRDKSSTSSISISTISYLLVLFGTNPEEIHFYPQNCYPQHLWCYLQQPHLSIRCEMFFLSFIIPPTFNIILDIPRERSWRIFVVFNQLFFLFTMTFANFFKFYQSFGIILSQWISFRVKIFSIFWDLMLPWTRGVC